MFLLVHTPTAREYYSSPYYHAMEWKSFESRGSRTALAGFASGKQDLFQQKLIDAQ